MNISKENFDHAARSASIETGQADTLWQELERYAASANVVELNPGRSRFDLEHLAYYFGAMIVLGAMGWFMSSAWEAFGGEGIFFIAAAYAAAFAVGGWKLWSRPRANLCTPGGLLVTLAVGMMPLMIYGLERWFKWWPQNDPGNYENFHPYVNGSWIAMELATVLAGAVALRFVRFPFLTAPVAFALWFLSMDLTPILFHRSDYTWDERKWVSLWFGLAMLAVAFVVDIKRRWHGPDYGFWLSLFGFIAFWGALTSMDSDSEVGKLVYCLINLLLMMVGVIVNRRAGVLFGAIGVNIYVAHLAHEVFANSLLFPFVLSLLGVLVIAGGVVFQRKGAAWRFALVSRLPVQLQKLVP